MAKLPLSVCIIARDEPLLGKAIVSVQSHVDEIVVVDTGSEPPLSWEKSGLWQDGVATGALVADLRFDRFTDCNDAAGQIIDFAAARNRSFDLARNDWILWMDADDTIRGMDRLGEILEKAERERQIGRNLEVHFPYEYAYDDKGRAISVLPRGRLLHRSYARWEYPIHEAITARPGTSYEEWKVWDSCPVWQHGRRPEHGARSLQRNVRILDAWLARSPDDPRALFYDGMDSLSLGMLDKAKGHLEKYVALGLDNGPVWQSDLCRAMIRLSEIAASAQDLTAAIGWLHRVIEYPVARQEAYLRLCKFHYYRAQKTGRRADWEASAYYGELGLSEKPHLDSSSIIDPTLRDSFDVHECLNVAFWNTGQTEKALESCRTARRAQPDNPNVKHNEKVFLTALAKDRILSSVHELAALGVLEESRAKAVTSLLEGGPLPSSQMPSQTSVQALSQTRVGGPLRVLFAMGDCLEVVNPDVLREKGLGGSETAAITMATLLAERGCEVTVATSCGEEKDYEGVKYVRSDRLLEMHETDVLIAWRGAHHLDLPIAAKLRVLWVHDVWATNATKENLARADVIFTLSEWHKDFLRGHYQTTLGVALPNVLMTRNGLDLKRFERTDIPRNPKKAIYSSSPDRGLDRLLTLWPAILKRVPDAELHVFYGFDNWAKCFRSPEDARAAQELAQKIAFAPRVVYRNRVNQKDLAEEMLSAGAWLYPTGFTETFCIGAAEAQAAGLHVVTSDLAALGQTVGDNGRLLPPPYPDDAFVDAAVLALEDRTGRSREAVMARARERFSWETVADQWKAFFDLHVQRGSAATAAAMAQLGAGSPPAAAPAAPSSRRKKKFDLVLSVFAAGEMIIDPETFPASEMRGGGSREGFMGLVKALGLAGDFEVTAWGPFPTDKEGMTKDGVTYRTTHFSPESHRDFLLGYYDTRVLIGAPTSMLRIGMHHTYLPPGDWGIFDWIDLNTAPSAHAMRALQDHFDPHGVWATVPNGLWDRAIERRPVKGRLLYHSSADRGLHKLLEAFPAVRQAFPDATLHVVGDAEDYARRAYKDPRMRHYRAKTAARMLELIQSSREGVTFLGKLSRADLNRELAEASCFPFWCEPSAPCETFSICTMECLRLGIPVVLRPADGLGELYEGHLSLVYTEAAFRNKMVEVLTAAPNPVPGAQEWARGFTFERQVSALCDAITAAGASLR